MRTRPIDPTSVRADVSGPIDIAVRVAAGEARCAGGGRDARARRSVPAIWISAHPGVPEAARTCDERGSNASAVAAARPASAEKEAAATRGSPSSPTSGTQGANQVWAYDFLFDACANGQQLKCLTVIDEYAGECLATDVAGSIRSSRVIEVLSKLVSVHGAPRYLRSDNGPEFNLSSEPALGDRGTDTAYIDPGKPWQNGSNESFNGKFRDECLGMQSFKNRIDAKILIEEFRRQSNEVRPHSSLGQLTR
jgi:putative transposase